MKLSLSVRIAESYSDKKKSVLSLEKICENAKLSNYQGICMRPSQIGIENSKEEILKAYQIVTSNNLTVSMVTGDFDIPANNELAGIAQRNITPYIDLCKLLNSKLIRIAIKNLEDVKYTQYACDEAKERGVNLVHQMHTGTMFETVDEALKIVSKIKRENFGIVYEPANLELCGQNYDKDAIKKLYPHIFNVYLQNQKIHPDGSNELHTWTKGKIRFDSVPVWVTSKIDFQHIINVFQKLNYTGFITIHQSSPNKTINSIKESAEYLRKLIKH